MRNGRRAAPAYHAERTFVSIPYIHTYPLHGSCEVRSARLGPHLSFLPPSPIETIIPFPDVPAEDYSLRCADPVRRDDDSTSERIESARFIRFLEFVARLFRLAQTALDGNIIHLLSLYPYRSIFDQPFQ